MTIRSSPLLGYNNNVRHKGKVFHIQTEDSGAKYGHIMTHLFADGGRILKSVKTSYAEYVGNERMGEIVREMMKQQHKAMFIALRDGKFDAFVDGTVDAPLSARTFVVPPGPSLGSGETERRARADLAAALGERQDRLPAASAKGDSAPPTVREPEELTLDVEVLERAAADPSSSTPGTSSDLPPPPAKLLREKTGAATAPLPRKPPSPTGVAASSERRYAPTRPASIFGQVRPQHGKSIFGEDLMGDKSLDEVILSYLADDLDGEKK